MVDRGTTQNVELNETFNITVTISDNITLGLVLINRQLISTDFKEL